MSNHKSANALVLETSPYLLQHAYNPVQWFPWGNDALEKAKKENKPIIVSIGYSACHWCHVMERESFENEELAKLMNEHYICIKVDREERPDVDQVYMDAISMMGLQGGWPLNVFLTPEQKPFYGGTYFPPQAWGQILQNVHQAFETDREKLEESAENFAKALNQDELVRQGFVQEQGGLDKSTQDHIFAGITKSFDDVDGGTKGAPKFPMPSIWQWLLQYYIFGEIALAKKQLLLTLDKLAMGGIYDQVAGGFSRYSVDEEWFAPHFEKMLYDNGQLLSLYASAYKVFKKEHYRVVVDQTISFIKNELTSNESGFYCALDADSEGIEGKYYTWSIDDFRAVAGGDAPILEEFFSVQEFGNWEDGRNILHTKTPDAEFAAAHQLDENQWTTIKNKFIAAANEQRSKRVKPGLDDKILTGWNGLMLKGLVDAYNATGEDSYLDMAIKNVTFLQQKVISNGQVMRSYKNGEARISGYLDDFAFLIDALIELYQATFSEEWLLMANDLTETVLSDFYHDEERFFYYTSNKADKLIARKKELFDNVIPGSNSAMAKNLYFLGIMLDKDEYQQMAIQMLQKVERMLKRSPQYLTNWAMLHAAISQGVKEIVIIGPEYLAFRKEISKHFLPDVVILGAKDGSDLPLLEGRKAIDGKTTVYVCQKKTCKLPVHSVHEAMAQINP